MNEHIVVCQHAGECSGDESLFLVQISTEDGETSELNELILSELTDGVKIIEWIPLNEIVVFKEVFVHKLERTG